MLAHWPAALTRESALPNPPPTAPIHVAIASNRTIKPLPGVRTHRTARLKERVDWLKCPPRVVLEHAAIDVALEKSDVAAMFAVLANVCQTRRTSPSRLLAALATRSPARGHGMLRELLADLTAGACSVLEREYLRLEKAHGLPHPNRQRPTMVNGKRGYLDVPYDEFGLFVELDSRAFHTDPVSRDKDFERDLEHAVTTDALTVRLTYGQVFSRGCRTIRHVATLLERRGWTGQFVTCPKCGPPR